MGPPARDLVVDGREAHIQALERRTYHCLDHLFGVVPRGGGGQAGVEQHDTRRALGMLRRQAGYDIPPLAWPTSTARRAPA